MKKSSMAKGAQNKGMRVSFFVGHHHGSSAQSFTATISEAKICLLLFLISTGIYSYFFIPMEKQTLFGMVLKCLPIFALQASILFKGSGGFYQQKILLGLILGSIGDAFLDFPGYFLHGTISFAFSQICYIWAFGMLPMKPQVGLAVLVIMSTPIMFITTNLMKEELMLLVTVTLYAPLLKIMVWRAVSRMQCGCSSDKETRDWPTIFGGLGAISFGISDATLALNRYYMPIPYAQAIIMSTYYLAQLGITLTTFTGESGLKAKMLRKNKSK